MNINKLIQRDKRIDSEIKLTKAGEKWAAETDSDKVIKMANFSKPDKINFNEFIGLALNPLLTDGDITNIFKLLKANNDIEMKDKSIKDATKTRNSGSRGQIRKLLSQHPNVGTETMKKLVMASRMSKPRVLQNPSIDDDVLNFFFEKKVMETAQGGYSFIAFGELMGAANLNQNLVDEWYNQLKKYADWTYKDNQWYSVVGSLVESEFCPVEVLEKVAGMSLGERFSHKESHREKAYNHPKANGDIQNTIYITTQDEKYLPQTAKDIFLF